MSIAHDTKDCSCSSPELWNVMQSNMIGSMRGVACYIIHSGVPENERLTRYTNFIRGFLWPGNTDNEGLMHFTEIFRKDIVGSTEERQTRPPMPDLSQHTEEMRQSFLEELARADLRHKADELALIGLQQVLNEYQSQNPKK